MCLVGWASIISSCTVLDALLWDRPRNRQKAEPRNREETEPRNLEETEPRNLEKAEPRDREKAEPRNREKTEPRNREKAELRNREETEPRNLEKAEPRNREKTEPRNREKTEPRNRESCIGLIQNIILCERAKKVYEHGEHTNQITTLLHCQQRCYPSTIRQHSQLNRSAEILQLSSCVYGGFPRDSNQIKLFL